MSGTVGGSAIPSLICQSPLYSTHTFYPLGVNLVFYTYNLFNALISLPLQAFLPLPAISNLTFLFATVFSGYGTFLLVDHLLRSAGKQPTASRGPNPHTRSRSAYGLPLAAFLSGLIYAFGSYRMIYAAIGHYNLWSTTWIPFYVLFLIRTVREPGLRNAVMASIFLLLAMLGDMMFGVFLGILTFILLAFVLAKQRRKEAAGGLPSLFRRLVVMGLVVLVLYSPLLVPLLPELFGDSDLSGWGDAEKLSVDLMGLVTPTALHPLGGDWTDTLRETREGTARFRDVNTVFLGWGGLALAIAGAVRYRRRLAAWLTSARVFAILSLGPVLQVNGRSLFDLDGLEINVPLPFILMHYLPVVNANRVPNRFAVVLMLALAVLAGFGAFWLLGRLANSRWQAARRLLVPCCLLLAALLLFDHWSAPLPLTDARVPPVYEQIAADPGDFAILQLPMGLRNSFGVQGAESTQTQYYQTVHHKRLLSGNISRNPPFKFDYFRQVPILDSLISIETYHPVDGDRRAADRASAPGFVRFYDIRYVVVAPGVAGRPPYIDTRDAAVAYVEDVLPAAKIYDQDGWMLYRVDRPDTPQVLVLDLGSSDPMTSMSLGEGWSGTESIEATSGRWAVAQDARVFVPAIVDADYRLTVSAQPFQYPGAKQQRVALWVNGHRWEPVELSPAPLAIEVNSGGPDDFAFISVGNPDAGPTQDGSVHRLGYNVAVIHPRTGELLDHWGFDTTSNGSELEAADLTEFIRAVPEGHIVVVSLRGDGGARLTDSAVAAFRSIGGDADPRGVASLRHAIVGVKGALQGTALETVGPDSGWLRVAPDRRSLAIAVDTIQWEQVGNR